MGRPQPNYSRRPLVIGVAAGICLFCCYSLVVLLHDAIVNGTVLLPRISRGMQRELVPWYSGWAYVLGLAMVTSASLVNLAVALGRSDSVFAAACLLLTGFTLMLFSASLSTPRRALYFLALLATLSAVLAVRFKFGKAAALGLWVLIVGITVWHSA